MKTKLSLLFILLIAVISIYGQALDESFGNGGIVISNFSMTYSPTSIATQSDGKVIVTTNITNSNGFNTLRFKKDGSQDLSFGISGISSVDFESLGISHGNTSNKILVLPDDRIIITGIVGLNDVNNLSGEFGMIRLNKDGLLDTTFGIKGKVVTDILDNKDDFAIDATILSSGSIIISGCYKYEFSEDSPNFAMVKYSPEGLVDSSFGTNGRVITVLTEAKGISNSVFEQDDGKIIMAGALSEKTMGIPYFGVGRYNQKGIPDSTFGANGTYQSFDLQTQVISLNTRTMLQPGGKIVTAGNIARIGLDTLFHLGTIRIDTIGKLDKSYGSYGSCIINDQIADTLYNEIYLAPPAITQADGKTIIAYSRNNKVKLYRITEDGFIDNSFGTNGQFVIDFEFPIDDYDLGHMVYSPSDNKILFIVSLIQNGYFEGIARIDLNKKTSSTNPLYDVSHISIYPNPVGEILQMDVNLERDENLSYKIIGIDGKTLQNGNLGTVNKGHEIITLPVNNLLNGFYYLDIYSSNKHQVLKFIKD